MAIDSRFSEAPPAQRCLCYLMKGDFCGCFLFPRKQLSMGAPYTEAPAMQSRLWISLCAYSPWDPAVRRLLQSSHQDVELSTRAWQIPEHQRPSEDLIVLGTECLQCLSCCEPPRGAVF